METSTKIVAICPNNHKLLVGRKQMGRRIVCPKCQAETRVPHVPGESVAAVTPPPLPPTSTILETALSPIADPVASSPARFGSWRTVFGRQRMVQGYRAEPSWVATTRWLALGVAVLAVFQLLPVATQSNVSQAPVWTRMVALLVVVQLAAAVQLATLPDWSTTRATLFLLAAVATGYGLVLGMLLVTPKGGNLLWDLSDVRDKAPLWCIASLLLLGLLIYAIGTVAHRWRKAFERTHAY